MRHDPQRHPHTGPNAQLPPRARQSGAIHLIVLAVVSSRWWQPPRWPRAGRLGWRRRRFRCSCSAGTRTPSRRRGSKVPTAATAGVTGPPQPPCSSGGR
jgi:hypothetical protein